MPKRKTTVNQRIRTFLKSDRGILLGFMGLSLFFWLLVKLSKEYQSSVSPTITYRLPSDKTFLKTPENEVYVTLEGSGWRLFGIHLARNRNVSISVQETGVVSERELISKMRQTFPLGVSIRSISPAFLNLVLDNKVTKSVPVRFPNEISLNPQFRLLAQPSVNPDSIQITGPATIVDTIREWSTIFFSQRDIQSPISQAWQVAKHPNRNVSFEPENCEIYIPIESLTEKEFFIPIDILNGQDSISIFPKQVKISATLGLSQYDSLSPANLSAHVDMEGFGGQVENNALPILVQSTFTTWKSMRYYPKTATFYLVQPQKDSLTASVNSTLSNQ